MFNSPEHALAVAFTIIELPIEPKNATQLIVEALRERHGLETPRTSTGLTPHDWHAQAVMIIEFTRRTLADRPDLWRAVLAEFSVRTDGAVAIQAISKELVSDLDGSARLLADMLVMRQFRRKPTLRRLCDQFDLSERTMARRERWWRDQVLPLRRLAMEALDEPMASVGLLDNNSSRCA